ncbi:Hypothetical_protein [Hexamita inflata]|uniref:Hypothetical_protein n=1 Tax=Hexamita inflata TaxID=28002 RepID=A0AA86NRD4_9EUKA|nr:Hypothetical protein HINF_LOCUS12133 [Hexamita inflata]
MNQSAMLNAMQQFADTIITMRYLDNSIADQNARGRLVINYISSLQPEDVESLFGELSFYLNKNAEILTAYYEQVFKPRTIGDNQIVQPKIEPVAQTVQQKNGMIPVMSNDVSQVSIDIMQAFQEELERALQQMNFENEEDFVNAATKIYQTMIQDRSWVVPEPAAFGSLIQFEGADLKMTDNIGNIEKRKDFGKSLNTSVIGRQQLNSFNQNLNYQQVMDEAQLKYLKEHEMKKQQLNQQGQQQLEQAKKQQKAVQNSNQNLSVIKPVDLNSTNLQTHTQMEMDYNQQSKVPKKRQNTDNNVIDQIFTNKEENNLQIKTKQKTTIEKQKDEILREISKFKKTLETLLNQKISKNKQIIQIIDKNPDILKQLCKELRWTDRRTKNFYEKTLKVEINKQDDESSDESSTTGTSPTPIQNQQPAVKEPIPVKEPTQPIQQSIKPLQQNQPVKEVVIQKEQTQQLEPVESVSLLFKGPEKAPKQSKQQPKQQAQQKYTGNKPATVRILERSDDYIQFEVERVKEALKGSLKDQQSTKQENVKNIQLTQQGTQLSQPTQQEKQVAQMQPQTQSQSKQSTIQELKVEVSQSSKPKALQIDPNRVPTVRTLDKRIEFMRTMRRFLDQEQIDVSQMCEQDILNEILINSSEEFWERFAAMHKVMTSEEAQEYFTQQFILNQSANATLTMHINEEEQIQKLQQQLQEQIQEQPQQQYDQQYDQSSEEQIQQKEEVKKETKKVQQKPTKISKRQLESIEQEKRFLSQLKDFMHFETEDKSITELQAVEMIKNKQVTKVWFKFAQFQTEFSQSQATRFFKTHFIEKNEYLQLVGDDQDNQAYPAFNQDQIIKEEVSLSRPKKAEKIVEKKLTKKEKEEEKQNAKIKQMLQDIKYVLSEHLNIDLNMSDYEAVKYIKIKAVKTIWAYMAEKYSVSAVTQLKFFNKYIAPLYEQQIKDELQKEKEEKQRIKEEKKNMKIEKQQKPKQEKEEKVKEAKENVAQVIKLQASEIKRQKFVAVLKQLIKNELDKDVQSESEVVNIISGNKIQQVWKKFIALDDMYKTTQSAQKFFKTHFQVNVLQLHVDQKIDDQSIHPLIEQSQFYKTKVAETEQPVIQKALDVNKVQQIYNNVHQAKQLNNGTKNSQNYSKTLDFDQIDARSKLETKNDSISISKRGPGRPRLNKSTLNQSTVQPEPVKEPVKEPEPQEQPHKTRVRVKMSKEQINEIKEFTPKRIKLTEKEIKPTSLEPIQTQMEVAKPAEKTVETKPAKKEITKKEVAKKDTKTDKVEPTQSAPVQETVKEIHVEQKQLEISDNKEKPVNPLRRKRREPSQLVVDDRPAPAVKSIKKIDLHSQSQLPNLVTNSFKPMEQSIIQKRPMQSQISMSFQAPRNEPSPPNKQQTPKQKQKQVPLKTPPKEESITGSSSLSVSSSTTSSSVHISTMNNPTSIVNANGPMSVKPATTQNSLKLNDTYNMSQAQKSLNEEKIIQVQNVHNEVNYNQSVMHWNESVNFNQSLVQEPQFQSQANMSLKQMNNSAAELNESRPKRKYVKKDKSKINNSSDEEEKPVKKNKISMEQYRQALKTHLRRYNDDIDNFTDNEIIELIDEKKPRSLFTEIGEEMNITNQKARDFYNKEFKCQGGDKLILDQVDFVKEYTKMNMEQEDSQIIDDIVNLYGVKHKTEIQQLVKKCKNQ